MLPLSPVGFQVLQMHAAFSMNVESSFTITPGGFLTIFHGPRYEVDKNQLISTDDTTFRRKRRY
jgi:hypothetical protein